MAIVMIEDRKSKIKKQKSKIENPDAYGSMIENH